MRLNRLHHIKACVFGKKVAIGGVMPDGRLDTAIAQLNLQIDFTVNGLMLVFQSRDFGLVNIVAISDKADRRQNADNGNNNQ